MSKLDSSRLDNTTVWMPDIQLTYTSGPSDQRKRLLGSVTWLHWESLRDPGSTFLPSHTPWKTWCRCDLWTCITMLSAPVRAMHPIALYFCVRQFRSAPTSTQARSTQLFAWRKWYAPMRCRLGRRNPRSAMPQGPWSACSKVSGLEDERVTCIWVCLNLCVVWGMQKANKRNRTQQHRQAPVQTS